MNGAEILVRTARRAGVEICFTNPGTTEMHLVAALDSEPGVRAVLGLFEGVVTGAADGYGRMAGKPALTLLHLGPGFANGIANLHNARRARTPIVNLIGHHATWQRNYDPPLNSDVEVLAAPVSAWQRTSACATQLSRDVAEAIAAARNHPGSISTLVVPADCQWNEAGDEVSLPPPSVAARADADRVGAAARALAEGDEGAVLLMLGGDALGAEGLRAAGRIAGATGCRLVSETFPARLERGPGLPAPERVPYFPEQAASFFEGARLVLLAGALDPVAFFGYRDGLRRLVPAGVPVAVLASPTEHATSALRAVADALDARSPAAGPRATPPSPPTGALDPASIAQAIAAAQPDGAIVIDEGVTAVGPYFQVSQGAKPHTYLALTGGAIGFGMPCATGAALACPDRKVILLEGDGSGLYTVQALWTQAREGLDVVNVVFSNSVYRILQIELHRAGVEQPGPQSLGVTELSRPRIDWQSIAAGFGVPAERVEDAESLHRALTRAIEASGPRLIEVVVG